MLILGYALNLAFRARLAMEGTVGYQEYVYARADMT